MRRPTERASAKRLHLALAKHLDIKGCITAEFSTEWAASKAAVGFKSLLDDEVLLPHIAAQINIAETMARRSYGGDDRLDQRGGGVAQAQSRFPRDRGCRARGTRGRISRLTAAR